MKRLIFVLIFLSIIVNAQVGIGTSNPNSILDVRGSLQTAYREVTASATLDINDYYVVYNGTSAATITLPAIQSGTSSFTGRVYRIKNISSQVVTVRPSGTNTFRVSSTTPDATITLNPGFFVELVNNANTGSTAAAWDASFVAQPIAQALTLYGATLKIPPYGTITNHPNTTYDSGTGTDIWWLISATPSTYEVSTTRSRPSRMTIVYEYQGSAFNLTGLQPLLTVGNSSSFPDIFSISFGGFTTTLSGKTRLTVSIARVDFTGSATGTDSNWQGTEFFINALFTKRTL